MSATGRGMQNNGTEEICVTVERGRVELIDSIADEWRALADQSVDDQPFYSPEFISAYIRAFAADAVLVLLTARINGELKAALPLIADRVTQYGFLPARRLRSPSNVHSLRFDLIKAPGEAGAQAVACIWKKLNSTRDYDFVELSEVRENEGAEQLWQAAASDGFRVGKWVSKQTPYISLQGEGAKPWLRSARKSLIETLKTGTKRIVRERGAAPTLLRTSGCSRELLDRFYAIEASGWKGKNGTAISCQPETLAFYDRIAEAGSRHGYFCLDFLYSGETLIAAAFGFIHRKKYFALKWAYDEAFQLYAPGHLLISALLEKCAEEGFTEFDFMGEKLDYVMRWTDKTRPYAFLYIFQRNIKGRIIERLKFGVAPRIRQWRSSRTAQESTPPKTSTTP
jgi:CelD/BcsL family acetyltransferase involved in cellulose biosynthesis